jgi:hypothetical protein
MAGPVEYLFGLWKSYRFAMWTPLSPEQAAAQLERSLLHRRGDDPGLGRPVQDGSVTTDRFTLRPRWGFDRQKPVINGQIVSAPSGGSNIVGELAYGSTDRMLGAVVPIVVTASFGVCGIGFLVSDVSWSSALTAAVPCAGVPTLCLVMLSIITIRTSRYHKKLRAQLCSVLRGVELTTQQ